MIFETHAHYDDEAFEADREELLSSMQENGIVRSVCYLMIRSRSFVQEVRKLRMEPLGKIW